MKSPWLTSVLPIAAIFVFRMLGLFMLIPIFTLYAHKLAFSTPALTGFALGAYGLSQGLLQIPFGLLSDKYGRKPMITIGLILLLVGSLIGAVSHSIYSMILARILQGMGAIGSVLIALLADVTKEHQRTKAMAVIGASIGLSFAFAMVLSPTLAQSYGLSGIFYVMVGLASFGLLLLFTTIPNPTRIQCLPSNKTIELLQQVLHNHELMRLNFGIFCQHCILTATFFTLPLLIHEQINTGHLSSQWQFYLYTLLSSFIIMMPLIFLAEKKGLVKDIFLLSIMIIALSQCLLTFAYNYWLAICVCMFLYFIAFNILEATLPSLISKKAPADSKGTAMGIYSTCQFLGIFAGGSLAGILFQILNMRSIFLVNTCIAIIWCIIANNMQIKLTDKMPTQVKEI